MIKAMMLVTTLLSMPQYLWADVTDSGNLSIGGQGVIAGTMTVQGNAFSVGNATFSVAGGSVTLGGRLNAAVAGIKWADGSTSTTAATTANVSLSSYAIATAMSGTGGSGLLSACVTGSSITLNVNGSQRVKLTAYLQSQHTTTPGVTKVYFEDNGAFISPFTSTIPWGNTIFPNNSTTMSSYYVWEYLPSNASHTWCLGLASPTGNWTISDSGTGSFFMAEVMPH